MVYGQKQERTSSIRGYLSKSGNDENKFRQDEGKIHGLQGKLSRKNLPGEQGG
jgi:hypothetical protein